MLSSAAGDGGQVKTANALGTGTAEHVWSEWPFPCWRAWVACHLTEVSGLLHAPGFDLARRSRPAATVHVTREKRNSFFSGARRTVQHVTVRAGAQDATAGGAEWLCMGIGWHGEATAEASGAHAGPFPDPMIGGGPHGDRHSHRDARLDHGRRWIMLRHPGRRWGDERDGRNAGETGAVRLEGHGERTRGMGSGPGSEWYGMGRSMILRQRPIPDPSSRDDHGTLCRPLRRVQGNLTWLLHLGATFPIRATQPITQPGPVFVPWHPRLHFPSLWWCGRCGADAGLSAWS